MNIVERILQIAEIKRLTINEFSKSIGVSSGYFAKQRANKANVGSQILLKIVSIYPDVNAAWLLTGEGEIFNSKTPKNVIKENDNKNDNDFDNKPKLQKTLSIEPEKSDINLPEMGEQKYRVTAIHGAGTPYDFGTAEMTEVAEPVAGYDPSLALPQMPPHQAENVFTGLTQKEVDKELQEGIRAYILDMYENGRAYPAAVVREYQAKIEALTTQVARLEYKNGELLAELAALRGKTGTSKGLKGKGKGVTEEK